MDAVTAFLLLIGDSNCEQVLAQLDKLDSPRVRIFEYIQIIYKISCVVRVCTL